MNNKVNDQYDITEDFNVVGSAHESNKKKISVKEICSLLIKNNKKPEDIMVWISEHDYQIFFDIQDKLPIVLDNERYHKGLTEVSLYQLRSIYYCVNTLGIDLKDKINNDINFYYYLSADGSIVGSHYGKKKRCYSIIDIYEWCKNKNIAENIKLWVNPLTLQIIFDQEGRLFPTGSKPDIKNVIQLSLLTLALIKTAVTLHSTIDTKSATARIEHHQSNDKQHKRQRYKIFSFFNHETLERVEKKHYALSPLYRTS